MIPPPTPRNNRPPSLWPPRPGHCNRQWPFYSLKFSGLTSNTNNMGTPGFKPGTYAPTPLDFVDSAGKTPASVHHPWTCGLFLRWFGPSFAIAADGQALLRPEHFNYVRCKPVEGLRTGRPACVRLLYVGLRRGEGPPVCVRLPVRTRRQVHAQAGENV